MELFEAAAVLILLAKPAIGIVALLGLAVVAGAVLRLVGREFGLDDFSDL